MAIPCSPAASDMARRIIPSEGEVRKAIVVSIIFSVTHNHSSQSSFLFLFAMKRGWSRTTG